MSFSSRSLELASVRRRDQGAADPAHRGDQRVGGETTSEASEIGLGDGEGRCAPRQPPARRLRRGADLLVGGRRVTEQQREQLAAAALALALLLSLCLGIAFDGVGGELVDVGEDRLGEQAELLGVGAAPPGGRRDVAPGDTRADAVGGLQRVEGPALAVLPAAQPDVDVAAGVPARLGVANQLDELTQGLAHPGPDSRPKGALERAGVLGDLEGDGLQDLLGCRRELRLDRVGDLGRQRVPGL